MKYFIRPLALALFLSACSGSQDEGSVIPEDLAGKRQLLKEKRAELKALNELIAELESSIAAEDPSQGDGKKQLVTTLPLERTDFETFVEIQGAVEADDLVDVTSEVAGRILKLTVEEGDNVRSGQLIASLDLEQVEKQIDELETSLELAQTVFERQSRLWEQNIGSELQYLEAKNNKERLEKSLETLQFQLSKSEVYAPASGVVDAVLLQSGELASPGMPIVRILNTTKLKVVARVPENYLRAVSRGDLVDIRFPALDAEQKARISLVGRTIDPSNRTFEVEAGISNMGGLLKPNLLAIVLINDFTAEDVVAVPLELVQEEVGGKEYVFVVDENEGGLFARRVYVETGRSYDGSIIITEGLTGDELLIADGARGLAENAPIKIQTDKTAAKNG